MSDASAIQQKLNAYLRGSGAKRTRQRERILEVLLGMAGHPTIEELVGQVRVSYPRVGKATVYRTVLLFEEAGILQRHRLAGPQVRLELVSPAAEHHDHLVCLRCGCVVEFSDAVIERRQAELAQRHGFCISSHSHVIRGLCSSCHQGARSSSS
jgi:Fur family ferric uptake transcriptional regulator